MTTKTKEDWCQCGDDVPTTWLGTCEQCGKKYLFPGKRKRVLHPLLFDKASEILVDIVKQNKECQSWRGISDERWTEAFHKLLDADFLSIKKGFFLMGCGVFCNPRLYHMCELYFTSKEGAELWKKLKYSGAMYTLDVCEKK